jgi:hypothetical protein
MPEYSKVVQDLLHMLSNSFFKNMFKQVVERIYEAALTLRLDVQLRVSEVLPFTLLIYRNDKNQIIIEITKNV